MGKAKVEAKDLAQKDTKLDEVMSEANKAEKPAIEDMPLNSLADYMRYNAEARKLNKKLRIARYPIKQCPIELHPKETIIFGRNDQPENPLHVYLSNEMINYKEVLEPGKKYTLPRCVVSYLASKGTPIWKKITKPDGTVENVKSGFNPRFAIRTIYGD